MEGRVKKNIVGFHVPMDYERGAVMMQIAESMCGLNCNVVSAKIKTQTNLLVQHWKPKDKKNLQPQSTCNEEIRVMMASVNPKNTFRDAKQVVDDLLIER